MGDFIVYPIFEVMAADGEEAKNRLRWLFKAWGIESDGLLASPVKVKPVGIRLVHVALLPPTQED